MNPRLKKILIGASYPLFYLTVFVLFCVATFPYERLKDRVEAEFNARQPAGTGTRLAIEDMSGYFISGIEADNVTMTTPQPADEDGKAVEPKVVTIEHVHARVSLLRLIAGTTHVNFGADAFSGTISGHTSDAGGDRVIELELEGVDVGSLPTVAQAVGLPMTGALTGSVQLRLPESKLSKAEGKIELTVNDLSVGDGKAKIRNTIALPKLSAGDLELVAEALDGRLKVEKLNTKGKDLELIADGNVRLRDPFEQSLVEMSMRFSFTDAYKNKNDITRGLFGAPGSSMPGLFDLDPKNKNAKRPDGFYAWRITGPFSRIDADPVSAGGGARPGNLGLSPAARGARGFSP
ncbi:MAG TPA: type II secretion system protein GspN [Polyangiaceae bacterium]|nr:type II secretion system protein GspN [Polyangiaceae bacterium]